MQYEEIKIPVVKVIYQIIIYINPVINNLPKPIRFSYGEKIMRNLSEILDLTNEANIELKLLKERQIVKAHAKTETTKIYVRILSEGAYIDQEQYLHISELLVSASKQLYKWLHFSRNE